MKQKSLFVRIFVSFIVLLVTPVLILGLVFRANIVNSYQQEVVDSNLAKLESIRDTGDSLLEDVRRTTLEVSSSIALERLSEAGPTISAINVEDVFAALDVLRLLSTANSASNTIRSIYLYDEGGDTVFTSDREIEQRGDFRDTTWIPGSGQQPAFPAWVGPRIPVDPEKDSLELPPYRTAFDRTTVVTYVSPLSPYVTTLAGAIASNVSVDVLVETLLPDSDPSTGASYIYDASSGVVLGESGVDADAQLAVRLLLTEIATDGNHSGYVTNRDGGDESIVFYAKSAVTDWYYLDYNEYSSFFGSVRAVTTLVVVVSGLLVLGGIAISYLVSRWLYNPVQRLVDEITELSGASLQGAGSDMTVLNQAFDGLRQQESALFRASERGRRRQREYLLMQLLQGADAGDELASAGLRFTESDFLCVVGAVDDHDQFVRTYSTEQRYYLKELVLKIAGEVLDSSVPWASLQYDSDRLVFLFNLSRDEWTDRAMEIERALHEIQAQVFNAVHLEISFSLGSAHPGRPGIEQSFLEALEGMKHRLISGTRSIFRRWEQPPVVPADERVTADLTRVLNAVKLGSEEKVRGALDDFFATLESNPSGYYGAIQAVNLLLASAIEYLMSEHIDPTEIFGDGSHPYEQLSSLETIQAIREWYSSVFSAILAHQDSSPIAGQKYLVRLVDYVDQHYVEDLSADAVAEAVGISYSYMRRLFRDELRTSFHDYVNRKRIEAAKPILTSTNRTMRDIATTVGYNNDQSFSRFFKKYEGITPGEYRRIS